MKGVEMKHFRFKATALVLSAALASGAQAQTAGNLLGAPLITTGSVLGSVAAGHAQIAPTVNKLSPTVEPVTDTVTNVLAVTGFGVASTGLGIQQKGVLVGSSASGKPLVSVGATAAANQGSLAAVLNGHR
jgi:hypothetical protein